MLVLSRKPLESIRIGKHINVVIVQIQGDRVKLGIEAPKDICVYRSEVIDGNKHQRKDSESLATSEDASDSDSGLESGQ